MNKAEIPKDIDIAQTWQEAMIWLSDHTTRIALAALFGFALVAALYGIRMLGRRIAGGDHPWWSVVGRAVGSMRLWFMVPLAAQIISVYAHAPEDMAKTIAFIFVITTTFQAALFLRELVLGAVELRAGEADPSGSLGSAIGLIRLLVTVSLFVVATILILSNLGVNVTGLVAGLGVGGIAIGLAAQGIFSDLFAALSILFDKPFRRGDFIRWADGNGTVEQIGLKSTRLRALTGEEVIVSNTNLLSKELLNITMSQKRRITQPFGLMYNTSPAACAAIPDMLQEIVEARSDCSFIRCVFDAFGTSSLDFILTYDIASHEIAIISEHKHAINVAILKRFADEGIGFANPTQTAFTAAPDGTLIMPYPDPAPSS
jgi:small-conductance mechanosensitive channel